MRASPSSHWNSAFSIAYATPSDGSGWRLIAGDEGVRPLAAAHHAHLACLALDRARAGELPEARLEAVVLALQGRQVGLAVRGRRALLDPVRDRPDVEQHDREQGEEEREPPDLLPVDRGARLGAGSGSGDGSGH